MQSAKLPCGTYFVQRQGKHAVRRVTTQSDIYHLEADGRFIVNASDFYGMDGVLARCLASHGCLSPELEALASMRRSQS